MYVINLDLLVLSSCLKMNLLKKKEDVFMFKRVSCILLVFTILLTGTFMTNVFAEEMIKDNISSVVTEVNENGDSIVFIEVDEDFSEEELEEYISSTSEVQPAATAVGLTYFLVRSGNTTRCEFFTRVSATNFIDEARWGSIKIQSSSSVFAKTYKTFSSVAILFSAMKTGNVRIGILQVPIGVKRVHIVTSNTRVHSLIDGWGSLLNFRGGANIN